jgi:uncharacterized protein YebE (UPF0316 family)
MNKRLGYDVGIAIFIISTVASAFAIGKNACDIHTKMFPKDKQEQVKEQGYSGELPELQPEEPIQ